MVKALDRQHGRFVALKIRPVWDGATRESLLNEARVLLAVPPHPVLPLVREDFFDGENYIVAMDWVDGIDLGRLLRDRGRPGLAPSSVLAYLSDAAQALTHLHAQDPPVIHGPHPRRMALRVARSRLPPHLLARRAAEHVPACQGTRSQDPQDSKARLGPPRRSDPRRAGSTSQHALPAPSTSRSRSEPCNPHNPRLSAPAGRCLCENKGRSRPKP